MGGLTGFICPVCHKSYRVIDGIVYLQGIGCYKFPETPLNCPDCDDWELVPTTKWELCDISCIGDLQNEWSHWVYFNAYTVYDAIVQFQDDWHITDIVGVVFHKEYIDIVALDYGSETELHDCYYRMRRW